MKLRKLRPFRLFGEAGVTFRNGTLKKHEIQKKLVEIFLNDRQDDDDCSGTMKPLPEDSGTLVPSHDLPDTGTLVSAILDLGTMVINSDTDTEATMKSKHK